MKKLAGLILTIIVIFFISGCNSLEVQNCTPIYAMDTTIHVTFYNQKDIDIHYQNIKKIYQSYDAVASDFTSTEGGSVYDLNLNRSMEVSSHLLELIETAISYQEDTHGYYNPWIGRLSQLWKTAIADNRVLEDSVILEERVKLEGASIQIEGNYVELIGSANLDLGGIAKGYATQKVKEYLDYAGVLYYLVNAGASNVVYSSKKEDMFTIGLEEPYRNYNIAIIKTKNNAIGSSSGKYQNTMIDGIRYHHLLNSFTGAPSNYYDNVNVMTPDSTMCDVYSTALFSMDLETAKAFIEEKGIEAILFKGTEILYQTDGWEFYDA